MSRETLLELAKRCELEMPSRDLDKAIELVARDRPTSKYDPHLPRYTSNVGAAKMLEPDDAFEICVRIYPKGAYVRITLSSGRPVYCEVLGRPITEAMARCAAALRAMAAMLP